MGVKNAPIESLKKGEFFKRKEQSKKVYVKDGYSRSNNRYVGVNYHDISDFIYLKKGKEVIVGFEF